MSRDKYAKKRAALLMKYWDWEWHDRRDGAMWIRCKKTGRIIEIGRLE